MASLWYWLAWYTVIAFLLFGAAALGAGITHLSVAKTVRQRRESARAAGRPWHSAELWLLGILFTVWFAFPNLARVLWNGFGYLLAVTGVAVVVRFGTASVRPWIPERPRPPAQFADLLLWFSSAAIACSSGVIVGNLLRGSAIDSSGDLSLPLVTDFGTSAADHAVLDWYTLLAGVTAGAALAVHGALWIHLRAIGVVRHRARVMSSFLAPAVLMLTAASAVATSYVQDDWGSQPAASLLVVIALMSLTACIAMQWRGRPRLAFALSLGYLVALCGAVAFLLDPDLLRSTISPAYTLTTDKVSAPEAVLRGALLPWFACAVILLVYSLWMHWRLWKGMPEE